MTRVYFYDTWAFVALADRADPAHGVAVSMDGALEASGYVAVTTDYVLDETLTFLNAVAGPKVSLAFLDGFLARTAAGEIQRVDVDPDRLDRAIGIFRRLAPAERQLSFTDATSFAVMQELSITHAFTADAHFHRAGRGIRPLIHRHRGRFAMGSLD